MVKYGSDFKPYKTGMMTVLERYPFGKGNGKSKGSLSITYANVIVERNSSSEAMNYLSILIPADVLPNPKGRKQEDPITGHLVTTKTNIP